MRLLSSLVVFLLLAAPVAAEEAVIDRMALKGRIEALLRDTKTASWYQDVWSTNGKEVETTAADCFWQGQELQRLNVKKGRGAGATAMLKGGKVVGFKPGMFSFVKLTFDPRDKDVLGIRGGDMRSNGFMDDLSLIVKQWDAVTAIPQGPNVVLAYQNLEGLDTKLTLDTVSLKVSLIEASENGKVVERFKFTDVIYNPTFDAKTFNP